MTSGKKTAARGIGAGIAQKFAAEGANVALIYSGNKEKAEEESYRF